jgi:CRP-like cAMP-binding protein
MAGTIVGELSMFDRSLRNATVTAASAMRLLVLTPCEFSELLQVAPCVDERLRAIAEERRDLARGSSLVSARSERSTRVLSP